MSTDTLDTLSDSELSERVAIEIAYGERCQKCGKFHNELNDIVSEINFATSADAVLPLLEKAGGIDAAKDDGDWWVQVQVGFNDWRRGAAKTFARAACLALLRAKT